MSISSLTNLITKNKLNKENYSSSKMYKDKLDYHNRTSEKNNIIIEKLNRKKDREANYIKSKSIFTLGDLDDIGSKISVEYTNCNKSYKMFDNLQGTRNDSNSGSNEEIIDDLEPEQSFEIVNFKITEKDLLMFENFHPKFLKTSQLSKIKLQDRYDEDMHPEYRKLNVPERLKKIFMDCVRTIQSLDIEIYGVRKNLENYHHGNNCCINSAVFIFSCKKNNFEFKFSFVDDGDCPTGCFYAKEIKNVVTQTKLETSTCYFNITRIYDKNYKFSYEQQKFLALINGKTETQFRDMFYGPLLRIPQLLNKLTKFKIGVPKVPDDYFNDDIYNKYYIKVVSNDKELLLYPSVSGGAIRLYFMHFIPTRTYEYVEKFYSFSYKTDSDIDSLIEYITNYFNRMGGNYGYKENGKYFNDKTFMLEFPNVQESSEKFKTLYLHPDVSYINPTNIYCIDTLDVENISGFDMFFVLGSEMKDIVKINMPYITDCYGIRFMFDKRVDPLNCVLTISPMYKDMNSGNLVKFSPLVTLHESYLDCVEIIKELNNAL